MNSKSLGNLHKYQGTFYDYRDVLRTTVDESTRRIVLLFWVSYLRSHNKSTLFQYNSVGTLLFVGRVVVVVFRKCPPTFLISESTDEPRTRYF